MRTILPANQLSVFGTVSSSCTDFSGRIQGQESTGVGMSISEENEKLSQQLNPQEVGWFFGKRLTQDKRSRGKLLARSLATIRNDESR